MTKSTHFNFNPNCAEMAQTLTSYRCPGSSREFVIPDCSRLFYPCLLVDLYFDQYFELINHLLLKRLKLQNQGFEPSFGLESNLK